MSWVVKNVNQIADFTLGKMLDEKKNKGDLLPYLANVNVRWGEFDLSELREMRFEQHELEKYSVSSGDIIMCEGGEPGRCAIWKDEKSSLMLQKALHRIRPKSGVHSPFLYYAFLNLRKTNGFAPYFTGSTIKHLPKQQLAKVEIPIPGIELQKAIASFLEKYDDLIENNRRRIQLLEESARLLYQEWFVHLRFPGHEQVKIIDGVPEGWEESTLGSLASVQSGYAFKSKDWLEAGNPVIKIKNITGDGTVDIVDCQCVDDNVAEKTQKFKLEDGDFLIAMTGATVGKVGIMPRSNRPYYLNQRVGKFEFVGETSREFVFCLANTKHFRTQIENLAGGAAQPNISGKQIESIKVLRPCEKILSFFSEQTHHLFEQRQLLIESNKKLALARDLLLPKLMSGELTV